MLLQPVLLGARRDAPDCVELEFQVPRSLAYFADHFPAQPMTPGVVQLGWAIHWSQREFSITQPFRKLSHLKFLHPILPDARLRLKLVRDNDRQVSFTYANAQREYSGGRLNFAYALS